MNLFRDISEILSPLFASIISWLGQKKRKKEKSVAWGPPTRDEVGPC